METNVLSSEKIHYYTKTVQYIVGGRRFIGDPIGFVITPEQPWVGVKESALRDFKIANKQALTNGTLIEIPEPSVDWSTSNVYTDEEIDNLFKNFLKLKSTVAEITSVPTVARMLERAKSQRRSEKVINLLEEKLAEIDHEQVEIADVERALNA